jgi:hypothetical protein
MTVTLLTRDPLSLHPFVSFSFSCHSELSNRKTSQWQTTANNVLTLLLTLTRAGKRVLLLQVLASFYAITKQTKATPLTNRKRLILQKHRNMVMQLLFILNGSKPVQKKRKFFIVHNNISYIF